MNTMNAKELKQKYKDFFKSKGHAVIDSAPLIPENDPTVLFTTAGMHPLVPYLVGSPHALGRRLVSVQKCLRTDDIEEVGDNCHNTFFEMLGNWSLGEYFKKESIAMSFEFLTKVLGLPASHLSITCFAGDDASPREDETANYWKEQGIPEQHIAFLGKKDNWWGPVGDTGPCGPDTEIFYWADKSDPPEKYNPDDSRWVEIWNNVFMQYNKKEDGSYEPLKQKNIDTGLGVERVIAILNGYDDSYRTELFWPIIQGIEKLSSASYDQNKKSMRIIADHVRSSVFILGDERDIVPSNVDQGYILRRLIRRAIRHLKLLGVSIDLVPLARVVIEIYKDQYSLLAEKQDYIYNELKKEQDRFNLTLEKGMKEFDKLEKGEVITGEQAFLLFQSFGFPIEMTQELAKEKGLTVDVETFRQHYKKHQELSRQGADQKFKGGLSDASEQTKQLHTVTHLLNEALRRVISQDIKQKGSNITPKRLRFDFNFDRKLTDDEKKKVEDEVNKVINLGLEITRKEMTLKDALNIGAQAEFGDRYPEKVFVYFVGDYSKEICMGPHVDNTTELGNFKIIKEESSAAGIRRIKAVLE